VLRFLVGAAAATGMGGCDSLLSPSVYGSVKVTVVRRDGTPIANVPVTVYFVQRRLEAATTDAVGSYTFERLPAGSYGVFNEVVPGYSRPEFVRPGPRTDFVDKIQVASGGTATAQLSLLKIGPGTIVATVTEPGGAGVQGIPVALYTGAGGAQREATTDAAGRVTFADVPFGDWGVQAVRPSRYLDSAEAPVVVRDGIIVDEGNAQAAAFTFAPCAGTLTARVLDDGNNPVPGAMLALYHFGEEVDSASTGGSGTHTFSALQCQDYGVRIAAVPSGWALVPGRGSEYMDGLFVHRAGALTATLRLQRVAHDQGFDRVKSR